MELSSQAKFSYFTRKIYSYPSQSNLFLVNLLIKDIDDMLIKVLDETELAIIFKVLNNIIFHSVSNGYKA